MPVLFDWESGVNNVMRVTFMGRWNWNEAAAARAQIYEVLDKQDSKVDFIICYHNENWLPGSYFDNMTRFTMFDIHPKAGKVVFVLKNELFAQLLRLFMVFNTSLEIQLAHAKTLDEARLHLNGPAAV